MASRFVRAVLVCGLALAQFGGAAQGNTIAPDLEVVLSDVRLLDRAIADDIRFRKSFALDARRETVVGLYENPERTVGTRVIGALVTQNERDELVIRDSLERDAVHVTEHFAEGTERRDRFGGVRIDHDAGGVLAVYLLPGASMGWEPEIRRPQRLRVRETDVSFEDLTSLMQRVLDSQGEDQAGRDVTGAWLDLDAGQVVVGFVPSSLEGLDDGELPGRFSEAFGSQHLRSTPLERPADEATATYIAGKRYYNHPTDDSKYCSFGFKVRREGVTNYDFALGAGHCVGNVYDDIYRNGSPNIPSGSYREKKFHDGSWGEVSLIRLDQEHGNTARVKHFGYSIEVAGVDTNYILEARRCISGTPGGTVCGRITAIDVTSTYTNVPGSPTIKKLIQVGDAADPVVVEQGDSGGGVYRHDAQFGLAYAAGVQASRGPTCPGTCHYAKFTKLTSVPGDWDVTVAIVGLPNGCYPPTNPCPLAGDDE